MSLTVIEPGVLSSIQDLGRPGHAALGVTRSGAADALALRIGNRLLGNPDNAAAIETTINGAAFRAGADTTIVLTGAPCEVRIDGLARPMHRPVALRRGESVAMGPCRSSARTYLCVSGGVRTEPVLGSRSTHATSGFGTREGRALRAGDAVPISPSDVTPPTDVDRESLVGVLRSMSTARLRVIGAAPPGVCTVGHQSDRVGVRLEPSAPTTPPGEIDSEAMHHGAIQATPDGALVALGPDAATTGGYPLVATIIQADLPSLGQLRPGDPITLTTVSIDEALDLLRARETLLDRTLPRAEEALS